MIVDIKYSVELEHDDLGMLIWIVADQLGLHLRRAKDYEISNPGRAKIDLEWAESTKRILAALESAQIM